MAQQAGITTPGPFGGLMRYDEEYTSRFMLNPSHVVAFVIGLIVFVLALKIFWPVA
ncbi:preprotein translocase subunit Sec61beta [Candidatus Pacearchaeota archaeon]|nr:preprotein translocase subunit Sec61beta [Candidatus Pacearchaeota archaeon]